MTKATTFSLIGELRALAPEYTKTFEESSAIRAAKFAHAIGLQDRKIDLHQRLFDILEALKKADKTEPQKEEIRLLVASMSAAAIDNKNSLELGFGALERISKRMMGVMKQTLQKSTGTYTANGTYYSSRNQSAYAQTDRTA